MDAIRLEYDLRQFHRRVADMETICDMLNNAMRMSTRSTFSYATWSLASGYLDALDAAYPGIGQWLEWWWLKCQLGANPLEASVAGGETRMIATIDDLVRLVLDDLEHAEVRRGR